jgi:hypothetical protein
VASQSGHNKGVRAGPEKSGGKKTRPRMKAGYVRREDKKRTACSGKGTGFGKGGGRKIEQFFIGQIAVNAAFCGKGFVPCHLLNWFTMSAG